VGYTGIPRIVLVYLIWYTTMSTQSQWQEVIEHRAGNQEAGYTWPGKWLLEKMAAEFEVYPLRFGGEDYGYLF